MRASPHRLLHIKDDSRIIGVMRRARIILILGIWVMVLPYLGFPSFWKNILFSASGLALVYVSLVMYREWKAREAIHRTFENFSENKDFSETPEVKI